MIITTIRLDTSLNDKLDNICKSYNLSKTNTIILLVLFNIKKIKFKKLKYDINKTTHFNLKLSNNLNDLLIEKSNQLNISKNILINLLVKDFIDNFSLV